MCVHVGGFDIISNFISNNNMYTIYIITNWLLCNRFVIIYVNFGFQYPEGYLEAQKEKEEAAKKERDASSGSDDEGKQKKKNTKRKKSMETEAEASTLYLHSSTKRRNLV